MTNDILIAATIAALACVFGRWFLKQNTLDNSYFVVEFSAFGWLAIGVSIFGIIFVLFQLTKWF